MYITVHRDACLDPDDVDAMLHGRLEPASLHGMEQHVAMCSRCRELLSALAQIEGLVAPSSDERFGRYVVATPRGEGAMGAVYAAYDPELDRKVALKILRQDGRAHSERERVQDRLRGEAQAMAQLAHPNVVAV